MAQDYIDSFDCALQEMYVALMGRLSVFRTHLGFHSTWPFEYTMTLLVPLEARLMNTGCFGCGRGCA